MENKEFKPYVPADKVTPEFTATSIIIGVLLAIIFGAANAYLGLDLKSGIFEFINRISDIICIRPMHIQVALHADTITDFSILVYKFDHRYNII